MIELIDLATWLAGAIIAIGLIQWAKGLAPKAPSWLWAIVLPIGAFSAAAAAGGDRLAWNALGIWAIAQVGWDAILRRLIKGISGAGDEGRAALASAPPSPSADTPKPRGTP